MCNMFDRESVIRLVQDWAASLPEWISEEQLDQLFCDLENFSDSGENESS